MFQSDFGIIADYFVKRRKGYKTIENHKQIKHVDEMLKFIRIFVTFLFLEQFRNTLLVISTCRFHKNKVSKPLNEKKS